MSRIFFVYIDEHGHTGGDLGMPDQPFLLYMAALVPAGERYLSLEKGMRGVADKIRQRLRLKDVPPLHAVDLYQRRGFFRGLGVEEALDAFELVLQRANLFVETWWAVHLKKEDVQPSLADMKRKERERWLWVAPMALLLRDVHSVLRELKAYGVLLVEAQGQHFRLEESLQLALKDEERRFQGIPCPVGKHHLLVATADFPAYVLGDRLKWKAGLQGCERPKMADWFKGLVEPKLQQRDVGPEVPSLVGKTY